MNTSFNNTHIQYDLFSDFKELLQHYLKFDNLLLLSDANTAAAYHIYNLPVLIGRHICLFTVPKATLKAAKDLGEIAKDYDAIIAVGSGSINDLAKYGAYHAGIPYVIIASAPSMNGYLSANSSLYDNGIKQTFKSMAPRALFADLKVLKDAPKTLIASGVGDVLCRSSVQFDMMVSHYLTGSDYPTEIFDNMIIFENKLLAKLDSNNDFVAELMDCLIYGGIAMQEYGNSAPASQSEHMLVHLLEMLDSDAADLYHHGQLVGASSLMMMQLQNKFLQSDIKDINLKNFNKCGLGKYFSKDLMQKWEKEYNEKLEKFNKDADLGKLKDELNKYPKITVEKLVDYLAKVVCEIDLNNMGFDAEKQSMALYNAAFTRGRFTILDLI